MGAVGSQEHLLHQIFRLGAAAGQGQQEAEHLCRMTLKKRVERGMVSGLESRPEPLFLEDKHTPCVPSVQL